MQALLVVGVIALFFAVISALLDQRAALARRPGVTRGRTRIDVTEALARPVGAPPLVALADDALSGDGGEAEPLLPTGPRRDPGTLRAEHLASLRDLVGYVTAGARARCEYDAGAGLWRAWVDAPIYERALIRATWSTEAGALRLLLRAARDPAFGGLWTARACTRASATQAAATAAAA